MESLDEKFMLEALKLAEKGIGSVEPNPAVGCVIVKDNKIIGKGYHKRFGGPHAEINAIKDCKRKGKTIAGAAMYVTLEPCCHFGKTPPCTDALIAAKLKRVVVAAIDPSKHANGKGIRLLKKAGIEIETGLCEKQAKRINAPFIKNVTTSKPWIIIKWAQSKDGFLASKKSRWISNAKSRDDAQILRRRADAILVGINTVIADDPLLTARPARKNKKLLRVILDSSLKIPTSCNLVKTAAKAPLLIFTTVDRPKIKLKGVEIVKAAKFKGRINLKAALDELEKRNIHQILVEGGPTVITSFLKQKLADEIVVYIAPKKLGNNGLAPATKTMRKCLHALVGEKKNFSSDIRIKAFQ